MKKSKLLLMVALSGLFLFSCTELDIKPSSKSKSFGGADLSDQSNMGARISSTSSETDVIDFEYLETGTIVSEVWSANGAGPIKVHGFNPNFPDDNAAMIFDSSNPTGRDEDLGTPNMDFGGPGVGTGGAAGSPYENNVSLGKVLILTEDFDSSDPDDVDRWGAFYRFDFSALGSVSVFSMHLMDVEVAENNATVKFFDAAGNQIGNQFVLPQTGDNGLSLYEFGSGVEGVAVMEVKVNGSGAIDNIVFLSDEVITPPTEGGCTFTQGYWKNHTKYSAAKRDATWDEITPDGEDSQFFITDLTYLEVLKTAPKGGNAYFILAHQYIAAKLNMLSGASAPEEVASAIMDAEALFNQYTPDQIGALKGSNALRKQFLELADLLDQYNNGVIGPGHCD